MTLKLLISCILICTISNTSARENPQVIEDFRTSAIHHNDTLKFPRPFKKQEYICTPCGLECDKLVFLESGNCNHCKMPLISKLEYEKNNRTVQLNSLKIDYKFSRLEFAEKEPEITEIILNGFESFKNLFGGNPRDTLNIEYNDFTVEIKQSSNLGGEADPKIIILNWSENTLFGSSNWKTVLLHELFHLWNAESFRYRSEEEHWFNEGFTEFYTYQTAAKLGLISQEDIVSNSLIPVGSYLGTKRHDNLSMREAGKNNKNKFENYFLVYHGGWVTAMVLDYDIRVRTNNKKNLDNLMRWLYENFQRTERLYDMDDIAEGIKITTGLDYTNFFSKYVNGSEVIPVSDYFDLGKALWDFKFNLKNKSKHSYLYETLGVIN
jgi:hypothetical protein